MPVHENRIARRAASEPEPAAIDSLDEVLEQVWSKLILGAEPKSSDYHVASVATIDERGWPCVRSVVLRRALRGRNLISFHTDARAPKFQQLQANPRVSWLFYSRRDKIQIRLQTTATIHHQDELAASTFSALPTRCQRVYMAPEPPGALHPGPMGTLPAESEDRAPTPEEAKLSREVFAVVDCRIDGIDWLHLAASGHRRAIFCWDGSQYHGSWTAP